MGLDGESRGDEMVNVGRRWTNGFGNALGPLTRHNKTAVGKPLKQGSLDGSNFIWLQTGPVLRAGPFQRTMARTRIGFRRLTPDEESGANAGGRIPCRSRAAAIQANAGNQVIPDDVLAGLQRQFPERPELLQLW